MTLSAYHLDYLDIAADWDLPWSILEAQAYVESKWDADAVGARGERGLAQIMEATWRQIWRYDLGVPTFDNAFLPVWNIQAQAAYLNWLKGLVWQKCPGRWDAVLWAFNWGIGNVLSKPVTAIPVHVRAYAADVLTKAADLEAEAIRERRLKDWLP